jgi:multidrug efflux system membrane fusion protein
MDLDTNAEPQKLLSRRLSIGLSLLAAVLGLSAVYHANHYPRTEDAEIFANFIGIAPQVDGPLVRLNVRDNQFVKKGELL